MFLSFNFDQVNGQMGIREKNIHAIRWEFESVNHFSIPFTVNYAY